MTLTFYFNVNSKEDFQKEDFFNVKEFETCWQSKNGLFGSFWIMITTKENKHFSVCFDRSRDILWCH